MHFERATASGETPTHGYLLHTGNEEDDDSASVSSESSSQSSTVTDETNAFNTRTTSLPGSHEGTKPKTRQTSLHDYAAPVINPSRQGKIYEELAKMIAADVQPFRIMEDKGFKRFSSALNPSHNLPSRKIVSNPDCF